MTDLEAAILADGIYEDAGSAPIAWAQAWDIGGVVARLWERPGTGEQALVFRGSKEFPLDFIRDLFVLPHTVVTHPSVGPVHAGAAEGLDELLAVALPLIRPGATVLGHSLGGMRATIFSAMMLIEGSAPGRIVTFGAPRPGFMKLADILAPIKLAAFRNGTGAMRSDGSSFDLVTDAVPHIPAILPYVRPREPQTDISAPPLPGDSFGVLGWHHSRLYLQGLQS